MTLPTLPPGIPPVIRVGPFGIEIVPLNHAEVHEKECFGEWSLAGLCIRIDPTINPRKFVDTFYHELLHAFYWAYGINNEDDEERTVGMLSSALVDFFRNNPDLADCLNGVMQRGYHIIP